jgi:SAM-dependent methyltransferase
VTSDLPPTRWEGPTDVGRGYGRHFADLIAGGADVEGEARLADALAPRGARILDAGSGMGRIGAALRRAGHQAVGVDLDQGLIEQSRAAYPDLPVARARLETLDAGFFATHGMPTEYDLVVCVGNVMVLLAEDSEPAVLRALGNLLAPEGRILVGFSLVGAPPRSRVYPAEDFAADVAAAGLAVESRYATFDLRPYDPGGDFAVCVLRRELEVSDH